MTLAEINLDADRVTRYRLPGHRRPGANSKKNGKKSNLFLMQLKIFTIPGDNLNRHVLSPSILLLQTPENERTEQTRPERFTFYPSFFS